MALFRVILLYSAVYSTFATDDKYPNLPVSNRLYGVASFAGISRNRQVSSISGIQIYPGSDMTMAAPNDGVNFLYTSTKDTGDGSALSAIGLFPGSMFVSSASVSGFGSEIGHHFSTDTNSPKLYEFIQPLLDIEKTRKAQLIEPWPLRNMYSFRPQTPAINSWFYPDISSFFNFS